MQHRYLIAYDIREPKRLRRTHKCLLGFGDPMQFSVFRCDLSDEEKVTLVAQLNRIIHHRDDRVMLADLGPVDGRGSRCMQFLGEAEPPEPDHVIIV